VLGDRFLTHFYFVILSLPFTFVLGLVMVAVVVIVMTHAVRRFAAGAQGS
jgi:cell division protein FtsL